MNWCATNSAQSDAARARQADRGAPARRAARGAGDLDLAKGIVHSGLHAPLARYRCDNCGFKARQFYWRCPACGGWETYSPKRTEEFDLTP